MQKKLIACAGAGNDASAPEAPRIVAIVPAAGIGARAAGVPCRDDESAAMPEGGALEGGAPAGGMQESKRPADGALVGGALADEALADGADARPDRPVPKQYRLLKGRAMLRWAVQALLADQRVAQVRVAVAPDDSWARQALEGLPRTVWRYCGGPTRAETVLAALRDAALEAADWVLVHDAARPGLPADALGRLIDGCLAARNGGLLALPVADTVKRAGAGEQPFAAASVARDGLWLAQTPQMFPAQALLDALRAAIDAGHEITDEASAIEVLGGRPLLVRGSARNFKVTWPDDFELMEKWL